MASSEPIHTSSDSSQAAAADTSPERPKFLESIAARALSCSHYVFVIARRLPGPVGCAVGAVEDVVCPRLQPLLTRLENRGLNLLVVVDEKLFVIGNEVEQRVPGVSLLLRKAHECRVLSQKAAKSLHRRGLVGAVADAWVEHETAVKSKSEEALNLARKIPLLRIFVPVVQTLGVPVAQAGSNWLSSHSEVQDKHLLVSEGSPLVLHMHELDADIDEKGTTDVQLSEYSGEAQKPDEKASEEFSEEKPLEGRDPQEHTQSEESEKLTHEEDGGEEVNAPEASQSDNASEKELATTKSGFDSDEDEVMKLFQKSWSLNPAVTAKK